MAEPVTVQPVTSVVHPARPPPGEDGGPVIVRNMRAGDADFAGRMTVEAFRAKFEHAVGKRRINGAINIVIQEHERMTQAEFDRHYIAEYEGRSAGLLALKFYGDRAGGFNFGGSNLCRELGCCGTCGLLCMSIVLDEDSGEAGVCYLDHICVDSDFRGKGIGKVLMERAEYEALKKGCHTIELWVAQVNRAKSLYERQGYTVVKDEDGACITTCAVGYRRFYKMAKRLQ